MHKRMYKREISTNLAKVGGKRGGDRQRQDLCLANQPNPISVSKEAGRKTQPVRVEDLNRNRLILPITRLLSVRYFK